MTRFTWAFLVFVATTQASAQTFVVTREGETLEVSDYEVRGELVVVTTLEGELRSLPLAGVDLDATVAANRVEEVALRFGWSPGMAARVEVEASRVRVERGERQTSGSRMSHDLDVMAHDDGLLVEVGNFEFDAVELEKRPYVSRQPTQEQFEQISALTPSYVVSATGEFVGVAGVEALLEAMEALIQPMREAATEMPEEANALVDRLLSEEQLNATMGEQWNSMVGFWLGGELELGAVYELETSAPIPLIPGLTIPMQLQFAVDEWVPCQDGFEARTCVALSLQSFPDAEQTAKLMASIVEQFAGAPNAPRFDRLHVENRINLVVVPETLVPYTFETYREILVEGSAAGERIEASRVDRRNTRFVWSR